MRTMFQLMVPDLLAFFGINRLLHSKERGKAAARAVLLGLLAVYGVGAYLFGGAMVLQQVDALSYLPLLVLAFTLVLPLLTTLFRVENVLFRYRGRELMASLPVSTGVLVGSRILVLTATDAAGAYLFLLPMVAVYGALAHPGPAAVGAVALVALFSPLLSVSVAALLGCLLLRGISRFAHNKLISIVAGFAVCMLAMALSFGLNTAIARDNLAGLRIALDGLAGVFPFSLIQAAAQGGLGAALLFALLCAGCFGLCAWGITAFYDKLSAQLAPHAPVRRAERAKEQGVRSPGRALFAHELRRYFSIPVYVLNTGFGVVLMLAFAVLIAVITPEGLEIRMQAPGMSAMLAAFAPAILSVFILMSSTTACALSLEGKSLPTLRAMPLSARTLLRAKMQVNLLLTLPAALLCAVLLIPVLHMTPVQAALTVLTPAVSALFSAVTGLAFNLRMPRMDWPNETALVKQSMSVLATILLGFAVAAAQFALCALEPGLFVLDAVLLALSLLLQWHNERRGYAAMLKKLDA